MLRTIFRRRLWPDSSKEAISCLDGWLRLMEIQPRWTKLQVRSSNRYIADKIHRLKSVTQSRPMVSRRQSETHSWATLTSLWISWWSNRSQRWAHTSKAGSSQSFSNTTRQRSTKSNTKTSQILRAVCKIRMKPFLRRCRSSSEAQLHEQSRITKWQDLQT